ncbi:MAG: hypothetical protein ABMA25_21910 [Ilumatobacteraceae bacterium]
MQTVDEFATMAVADLRAEAARIADTEAALADVRGEVQLVAAAPTGRSAAHRHRRRRLLMVGAAAACAAVVVAAVVVGRDDQSVRPAESVPSTSPASSTTAGAAAPSMSSPLWDEETGSEIVFQFEGPSCSIGLCANWEYRAPLVASDGRIVIGERYGARWIVAINGEATSIPYDESWTLRDAAMAPDDTVYAVFVVGNEQRLYRYPNADMASPELIGEPRPEFDNAAVVLDVGGATGDEQVEFKAGTFFVHRPMNLADPSIVPGAGDELLVAVTFVDGSEKAYHVHPSGAADRSATTSIHPLLAKVAVILLDGDVETFLSIKVLLPDGSMRERQIPLLQAAGTNAQRFVDEGYYYLLTAETTGVGVETTTIYSVRRFALPTEDSPAAAATTTLPSTTTVPAGTEALVSGTSLAGVEFGTLFDEALPSLANALGERSRDVAGQYPDNIDGKWSNGDESFSHPFMRQLCWEMPATVCAVFGGEWEDQLTLVGWWASGGPNLPSPVSTSAGLRVGSVAADFGIELIPVPAEGCTGLAYGHTDDGIHVTTIALGEATATTPDSADVVIQMVAGEPTTDSAVDC